MAIDHVKSAIITGMDNPPPYTTPTTGEGAKAYTYTIEGHAVVVAASSVGATYQLVRLPSTSKVKDVIFESAAQGAGVFNIGVFYATDKSVPGKPTTLLVADAIDADFFGSSIDCASAVARTDITNEAGFYPIDKRHQPLWQALGLASDPGGNFDIVASVITTAVTTGTGRIGLTVKYAD